MTNTKGFWIVQMLALLAFYGYAAFQLSQGHGDSRQVLVAGLILGAHTLEIPLAFAMLKGKNAQPLRVIIATQLFGLLWWVPARRGLFALR